VARSERVRSVLTHASFAKISLKFWQRIGE
jgi:hypothetical protein